jgi:hypothetical protein
MSPVCRAYRTGIQPYLDREGIDARGAAVEKEVSLYPDTVITGFETETDEHVAHIGISCAPHQAILVVSSLNKTFKIRKR